MNFFNQGIPLGKWFGITVVIHWTFLIYAAYQLFGRGSGDVLYEALFIGLLFGTVLIHEFGHALSCRAVGGQAFHIVLWPLGGIAFVQPPMNPVAWLVTTACGPLVNAVFWPLFFVISRAICIRQYGPDDWDYIYQTITHAHNLVTFQTVSMPVQVCLFMWQINKLLLLFNLIPAYPMDGGRMLQEVLWLVVGYGRSLMIAGMVGTAAGAGFVIIGLGVQAIHIPVINFDLGGSPNPFLTVIGLMCAMQSFGIYRQSQEIKSWRKN